VQDFSDASVLREAEAFASAEAYRFGEELDLWEEFLDTRDDLVQSAPWEPITRKLEGVTAEETVPSPDRLRKLLKEVETYRKRKTSGGKVGDSGPGGGEIDDEDTEAALQTIIDESDDADSEDIQERLEMLRNQIRENVGDGGIVAITKSTT
jgi:hypothetical protein